MFDDWYSAGPEADDYWQRYESSRGSTYIRALQRWPARHVFQFDKFHLDRADIGILVYPAGRSGHMELGYLAGRGKPTYVLLDKEPERWDVMLGFCAGVFENIDDLVEELKKVELE